MKLTRFEQGIVGSLLAGVNYLQLELGSLSHPVHIAIGTVSILLGTLIVNSEKSGL